MDIYKKKYDEALERARKLKENPQSVFNEYSPKEGDTICDYIFPELKESEDERIRKEIIEFLIWLKEFRNGGYEPSGKYVIEDMIAWLEKQGEPVEINPSEFDTRLQALIGKFDSLPKEELIGSLSFWMNVVQNDGTYKSDEKQGEQKPALRERYKNIAKSEWFKKTHEGMSVSDDEKVDNVNKIEPKFKVGDWIVNNVSKDVFLIKSINNGYCTLEDIKGNIISPCLPPCESESHLWTIQDAKDGDVLCYETKNDFIIFIYKNGDINYHCCYNNGHLTTVDSFFAIQKHLLYYIHPATKEQRDLLFQKMHEVSYEWDKENKELKKIEQKPAWSEEDERNLNDAILFIETGTYSLDKDNLINWLKSLRPQWKPSDEQLNNLKQAIDAFPYETDYLELLYDDLKKLKGE